MYIKLNTLCSLDYFTFSIFSSTENISRWALDKKLAFLLVWWSLTYLQMSALRYCIRIGIDWQKMYLLYSMCCSLVIVGAELMYPLSSIVDNCNTFTFIVIALSDNGLFISLQWQLKLVDWTKKFHCLV